MPAVFVTHGASFGLCFSGDLLTACENDVAGRISTPAQWADISSITGSSDFTLGLKSDGTVVGCGHGFDNYQAAGVFNKISAGTRHALGLSTTGVVTAWGVDTAGCVNDINGLTGVVDVACTDTASFCVMEDGTVTAAGDGREGQITGVAGWTNIASITCGFLHTLGIKADGTVIGCGNNDFGQLDNLAIFDGVAGVQGGYVFNAAVANDGSVLCNGYDGDEVNHILTAMRQWTNITKIALHPCALHALGLQSDDYVVAAGIAG